MFNSQEEAGGSPVSLVPRGGEAHTRANTGCDLPANSRSPKAWKGGPASTLIYCRPLPSSSLLERIGLSPVHERAPRRRTLAASHGAVTWLPV